ncbi:MAG: hypothetical protein ACREGK_08250 [Geminicoccales bacterium]
MPQPSLSPGDPQSCPIDHGEEEDGTIITLPDTITDLLVGTNASVNTTSLDRHILERLSDIAQNLATRSHRHLTCDGTGVARVIAAIAAKL